MNAGFLIRSALYSGFWVINHPDLWAVVDDFGDCVPVSSYAMIAWIDSGTNEQEYG